MNTESSPGNVPVTVLLFGKARELAGAREVVVSIPKKISYSSLKELIFKSIGGLESIFSSCMLALNQAYLNSDDEQIDLDSTSELAVIPPLSGG
ncbi:hypothetical protein QR680_011366 [Steinernema hermaphroditum]|uniref:Molybdopterin synthase sulfur carrier subunit n=1 Tax=Steinernema hermaphroditum TaxID=289476 RepID=A0AA39IS14_9BILA|nr:hypothetical protein QR680_011366 [Steinernema hermaphroditum]